jgi:two-component system chemotaxis response regulator CheY
MGKVVIVVDDSNTARAQVKNALTEAGYQVLEAVNGRDGLLRLGEHPEASLVVCDVNMPVMGGLEMLEQMKTDSVATPVLMLTTEADPEMQRRGKRAGVAGWVVKPFNPVALVRTVRAVMREP